MKKAFKGAACIFIAAFMLLSLSAFAGCRPSDGDIGEVNRKIDNAQKFSEADINAAMDAVAERFKDNFKNCKLLELSYDEERGSYAAADKMILYSSFTTSNNADLSLEPNTRYDGYSWTLKRTNGGKWKIEDSGYA